MNTYLLPITDGEDIWIERISAKSIKDAESKFMMSLIEAYQDRTLTQIPDDDWDKFLEVMLSEFNITVGDIYDIEEF